MLSLKVKMADKHAGAYILKFSVKLLLTYLDWYNLVRHWLVFPS